MIFSEFPISGPLGDVTLILEWLTVFLYFQLTIIVLKNGLSRNKKRLKEEYSYMFLFLGYSVMWFCITLADHYFSNDLTRTIVLNIGYLIQVLFAFVFIFFNEWKIKLTKRFEFTILYTILFLIYIIIIISNIDIASTYTSIFWVIFVIFMIYYIRFYYSLFNGLQELEKYKKAIMIFAIGLAFTITGYQLTARIILEIYGVAVRLIGDLFQVFGLIMLYQFFNSITSFSEFFWKEKIHYFYIIHKSGLLIYEYIKESTENNEEKKSIDSGVIATVKIMLDTILQKEEIVVIKRKDKILTFYPGKHIFGVLISDDELVSHKVLLTKIMSKIENLYQHVFESWTGELKIFSPINTIMEEFLK